MRRGDDDVKSGYTTNSMTYNVTFSKVIEGNTPKPSGTWIYYKAICSAGLPHISCGRGTVKTPFRTGPLIYRLLLCLHFLHLCTLAAGDYYSGYMDTIITNHTASACEGQVLYIRCPMMSTIDIQSAMYGRKVPSEEMCPVQTSIWGSFAYLRSKESTNCEAVTSFAKTAAECKRRRYCGLLVHSRVFGDDPCPGTTKYLTVNYKCQLMPDEFKTRGSCDDETMVVRCAKVNYVIAVYNVTMTNKEGCRKIVGSNCTITPESALEEVTARCHKRQRCTVRVAQRDCANYMHLEYACIPKRILTDRLPSSVLHASSDGPLENPLLPTTTAVLPPTTLAPTPSEKVHPEIRIVATSTVSTSSTTSEVTSSTPTSTEAKANGTETKETDIASEDTDILTTTTSKPSKITVTSTTTTSSKSTPKKRRKSTHTPFVFRNHFATTTSEKKSAGDEGSKPGQVNTTSSISQTQATTPTVPMVVEGNTTATYSAFPFFRSVVALATYIRENKEQVLIIFLSCLCIGLFLTVCMLICKIEEKNLLRWRRKKKKGDQTNRSNNEGTESASLLGAAARQSQTGSSTASPGNVYSAPASRSNSNGRVNHIEYMNQLSEQRRRKQRSRMRSLMNKWCSCCCRNAPWQRDQQSDDYQTEHRSTSLSDDDAISAVASGRSHFDVEPQPIFAATSPDSPQREEVVDATPRYNAFPNAERLSDEIPYADDDTSEYDYHDNDVTPPKPEPTAVRPTTLHPNLSKFSPSTAHSSSTFGNPGQNVQPVSRNPYLQRQQMPMRQGFTQPHQAAREPPPFPKHSTYGYQVPPQSVPHYATQQRVPFNSHYQQQQQQPQRIRTNPMAAYHTQQRHPASFTSSFNEHYVSLQPQHHQASSARTLSLGQPEARLERRGSWYDNSRESPMYEYFQRQGRQELPGTKNLNQYY